MEESLLDISYALKSELEVALSVLRAILIRLENKGRQAFFSLFFCASAVPGSYQFPITRSVAAAAATTTSTAPLLRRRAY